MSIVPAQVIHETDVFLNGANQISIVNRNVESLVTGKTEDVIVTFPVDYADAVIDAINDAVAEYRDQQVEAQNIEK